MNSKLHTYILFFCCLFIFGNGYSQYTIEWQKSIGGSALDLLLVANSTVDGGTILAGYSNSSDGDVTLHYGAVTSSDFWVVKLDETGAIEWQKTLGGTKNDAAYAVQQTNDGGYIVAGESYSDDMDVTAHHGTTDYPDFWVVKLSESGTIEWQKSLGGTHIDAARSIAQTADNGFIVAGYSWSTDGDVSGNHGFSDFWIVKITSVGTLSWQKSFGGSGADAANSIIQSEDGEYLIAGNTYSDDGDITFHSGTTSFSDCWLIKLYDDGSLNWQRSFGGTDKDEARNVKQTAEGGFIIVGNTYSSDGDVTVQHGNGDYWVLKIGVIGNVEWQKSLGGTFTDIGHDIVQTTEGSYAVSGVSNSVTGDITAHHGSEFSSDFWLALLSGDGTLMDEYSLGGTADDAARSVLSLGSSEFIVAGNSISADGDISGGHGAGDYCVIKLNAFETVFSEHSSPIKIYPNPADAVIIIETDNAVITPGSQLQIIDMEGRIVYQEKMFDSAITLPLPLSSGIYTVNVYSAAGNFNSTLIIK